MRSRNSSDVSRSSAKKRRSDNFTFDEFGFALTKTRKDKQLYHRCHDYSYPQLSSVRVKELCELLSYWNGSSFICRSQIERFIRLGIPASLRGQVWKCLLSIDTLRETSEFSYQKCLLEVRGPLVDLGVSEYGILSAISTLSDTQNDLGSTNQQPCSNPDPGYSRDDVTLFRQIALDLQRSFPTHRSLMGESPEAIEGQAKLFRVLTACAKYNPQVGYSQGMSYIAAVLLMHLGEEHAFWALVALLDEPKHLSHLFDLNLTKVQHQVEVFDQFLKHRKPAVSHHLETMGVSLVHFVMPWFLTLFTSLPCWDSILAVWDLIMLHGLPAVFRTALTIIELLETKVMSMTDEGSVLPLFLRVPVEVAQYSVLVPALWNTEVQDWEMRCMDGLVLDERHKLPITGQSTEQEVPLPGEQNEGERRSAPLDENEKTERDLPSRAKSVLTHMLHLAQRYLSDPVGRRERGDGKESQSKACSAHTSPSPGPCFKSKASASLTQAQARARRRSQQKGVSQTPVVGGAREDTSAEESGGVEWGRPERLFKRIGSGPVGKVARRRSNPTQPIRLKSLRLLRRGRNPPAPTGCPPAPSVLPPSLRRATLTPSSTDSSSPPSSQRSASFGSSCGGRPLQDTPRTSLIKKLSSRHQTIVPLRDISESKLI